MKKVLIVFVILSCFIFSSAFADTWYVRPSTGEYGAEDGTSYETAWDGLSDITWGVGGVVAGDTLYVCGRHNGTTFNPGDEGSEGSPIIIRGDYPGDPGAVTVADVIDSGDWTGPDGNGEYYITISTGDERVLLLENYERGIGSTPDATGYGTGASSAAGSLVAGGWAYDTVTGRLYYKPTSGTPADHVVEYLQGYKLTLQMSGGEDYISFYNIEFYGGWRCVNLAAAADNLIFHNVDVHSSLRTFVWNNSDNTILRNSRIYDSIWKGIGVGEGSTNGKIINNRIYDINKKAHDWKDSQGICIGRDDSDPRPSYFLIERNHIYNIGRDAESAASHHCGIAIDSSDDITIRRNRIYDCWRVGINVHSNGTDTADSVTINNNLIYNIGKMTSVTTEQNAARLVANGGASVDDYRFIGNTIYNINAEGTTYDQGVIHLTVEDNTSMSNSVIKNNAVIKSTGEDYVLRLALGTGTTTTGLYIDYNLWYDYAPTAAAVYWDGTEYTFAEWYTNTGHGEHRIVDEDPLITSSYRLKLGSPAIDVGGLFSVYVPGWKDFFSSARICGDLPDIGAHEFCLNSIFPPFIHKSSGSITGAFYADTGAGHYGLVDSTNIGLIDSTNYGRVDGY